MKKIVVAIDGPAGAGKSTIAKLAAEKLGYAYIDTGAMYRSVAWKFLQTGKPFDEDFISGLSKTMLIDFKPWKTGCPIMGHFGPSGAICATAPK